MNKKKNNGKQNYKEVKQSDNKNRVRGRIGKSFTFKDG